MNEPIVSKWVKYEIDLLFDVIETNSKCLIKTKTIRDRVTRHMDALIPNNEEIKYWYATTLCQVIQSYLQRRNCRSVKKGDGYFVCLDYLKDPKMLADLYANADADAEIKRHKAEEIFTLWQDSTGQYEMNWSTENDFLGYSRSMTEDEFMNFLEANAI